MGRIEAGPGMYDPGDSYGGGADAKPWQRQPTGGAAPWQRERAHTALAIKAVQQPHGHNKAETTMLGDTAHQAVAVRLPGISRPLLVVKAMAMQAILVVDMMRMLHMAPLPA